MAGMPLVAGCGGATDDNGEAPPAGTTVPFDEAPEPSAEALPAPQTPETPVDRAPPSPPEATATTREPETGPADLPEDLPPIATCPSDWTLRELGPIELCHPADWQLQDEACNVEVRCDFVQENAPDARFSVNARPQTQERAIMTLTGSSTCQGPDDIARPTIIDGWIALYRQYVDTTALCGECPVDPAAPQYTPIHSTTFIASSNITVQFDSISLVDADALDERLRVLESIVATIHIEADEPPDPATTREHYDTLSALMCP